jgi:hypothetical protein
VEKIPGPCSLENEELLKEKIFSIFTECQNETSSDRRQVLIGRLWEQIIKWYGKYLSVDAYEMGKEIFDVIRRITKEGSAIPQNKEGFIKYLITALKRGKHEYIRNYETKNKDDLIRMKESSLGRKLSDDERTSSINRWYDFDNAMKITGTSLTGTKNDKNPQTDYLNSTNTDIILKAINAVLGKKQKRSRPCLKALLTLHCIDNIELYPVLDDQIIEACKYNKEKPRQYEIYQKYHPKTSKGSSEAMASKNLKEILSDIEAYLKEKNPEIFH